MGKGQVPYHCVTPPLSSLNWDKENERVEVLHEPEVQRMYMFVMNAHVSLSMCGYSKEERMNISGCVLQ